VLIKQHKNSEQSEYSYKKVRLQQAQLAKRSSSEPAFWNAAGLIININILIRFVCDILNDMRDGSSHNYSAEVDRNNSIRRTGCQDK